MSQVCSLAVTVPQTRRHTDTRTCRLPPAPPHTHTQAVSTSSSLSPSPTRSQSHGSTTAQCLRHTRGASPELHTQPPGCTVLKSCTRSRPPARTLSHSLTLGLSQHPHLRPPGPSAGLQLQQVTPFLPFLCFSFLLFPLRNLVPVRKPKPFPTQGPGPGRNSQMTDKALPGPPALLHDLPS